MKPSLNTPAFCVAALVAFATSACLKRLADTAGTAFGGGPRYVGRTWIEPGGVQRIAWSGTQVITAFTGPMLTVHLEAVPDKAARPGAAATESKSAEPSITNVFDVIVDDAPPKVIAMHPGQTRYVLCDNLSQGAHHLTLIKRTEPLVGEVRVLGFEAAQGFALLPPAPPRLRRLEFIGDSITAGYGNEGADANCKFTPLTENGDLAFGPMTARALEADASIIAWSGHGLIRNRDLSTTDLLPELYARTVPSAPVPAYDPNGWHPDAVIINLGTNDFAPGLPDAGRFEAAYVSLITAIHKAHPKAHVVLGIGPMLSDQFPTAEHHLSVARTLHQEVIAQLKAHGDNQVSLIEFPTQDGRRGFGCDWHPSLATHAAMAAQLTQTLRTTLGW